MIDTALQVFCNRMVAAGRIARADVQQLARSLLRDGLASRDDADMLIALERAIPDSDPSFGDLLVSMVVDFAVWGERPTGYIDREVANWLAASLSGRNGPTPIGARIALELVQAAESSDETLLAFALAANPRRNAVREPAPHFPLAA
jgi:hypothetical protein